jgi:hypothetical protein
MRVKNAFQWHRNYSASPQPIEIPAGAPVHKWEGGRYYVDVSFFKGMPIEAHDAEYYGCPVAADNVEE